jgi:DnaJ-class molecular chaperone
VTPAFVECPDCGGSGRDDALSAATGEEEPCARCTGEGMVEASEVER